MPTAEDLSLMDTIRPAPDREGESSPPVSRIKMHDRSLRLSEVLSALAESEEALRRSRADLARVQKLDALGRLAGAVAHDINNFLTIILGNSTLIQRELPSQSPIAPRMAEIHSAAERVSAVTRQLLAVCRLQPRESSVVDLASVIDSMQTMLRVALEDRITLEIRYGADHRRVLIDSGCAEQILMNLVLNARDAMPAGGHLSIVLRNEGATGHDAEWVVLEVTDSGTGIESSLWERIFEPFFTTKAEGRGTGLGLWVVRDCVSRCGGAISVESTLGRGTTFELRFPCFQGEDESPVNYPV